MAGLSGCLAVLLAALTAWAEAVPPQEPASPPGHLERVQMLMRDRDNYSADYWLKTMFQSLTRLEHGPTSELSPAWEAMAAAGGGDWGASNLVLYTRRHGLPLPSEQVSEGADPSLERALAAWGESDLGRTEELLMRGAAQWPEDSRWSGNLGWLRLQAPPSLSAQSTARELALVVLAARGTLD